MSGVDPARLREIVDHALDLPPSKQEAYLCEACADDTALLDEARDLLRYQAVVDDSRHALADERIDAQFERLEVAATLDGPTGPGLPVASDRIGPYRIVRALGEGGMGLVFEAEQTEPVRRSVALKIIKPGMDSRAVVARFEAERQALALMDHPSVARVFDGGTTPDGRPYFAMELVRGAPITEHCDRHKLGVRDRLELFIRVCEAVQHAHAKGVIHRDLKPSNILVAYEDGRSSPKVIDFGIAKALGQKLTDQTLFTAHGQIIGTPEYMSPEQAEMGAQGIDTRSDVYALGVILYELLSGERPFDQDTLRGAPFDEIRRILREVEPPRPSTRLSSLASSSDGAGQASRIGSERGTDVHALRRTLQRDLDWVVMRCLEKDRERRYGTVSALADDLRRFLDDEPVSAGPPTARYRFAKFARRHRVGLAMGGVVSVLVLGGLAGTTYGLLRAERALAGEQARAEELERVAAFQADQLSRINPERMGWQFRAGLLEASPDERRDALERELAGSNFTTVTLRSLRETIFEPSIQAIDEQFVDQPLVRARLLLAAAETMNHLGLHEAAIGPQERALALVRADLPSGHEDVVRAMSLLGLMRLELGDLKVAEDMLARAYEIAEASLGEAHPLTLYTRSALGRTIASRGGHGESERLLRRAVELRRQGPIEETRGLITSLTNLASVVTDEGRYTGVRRSIARRWKPPSDIWTRTTRRCCPR